MANYNVHTSESRGHANHGWLDSRQSFSFSGYYNPKRMQFGALRVLNDDVVEGGKGFGLHPHDNMEIVSIVLEGALEHKDNMGHTKVLKEGEVQVMSTGSGIFHSEYNKNPDRPAKFLQIWLYPNRLNVKPRYDQVVTTVGRERNRLVNVISPAPEGVQPEVGSGPVAEGPGTDRSSTWIYQDAWFSMGVFDRDKEVEYALHREKNGLYVFVINGSFAVDGKTLQSRDGLEVTDVKSIGLRALEEDSQMLIMEVPLKID